MSKILENNSLTFHIEFVVDAVPQLVEQIKESCGEAYSAFSGRPVSLCKSLERRGELRMQFEEPVYLWPVSLNDTVACCQRQQPIVAVTRDISAHGVGFRFDEKIESEYLLAEFDLFGAGTIHLLLEVRWTAREAAHAYSAGGLILGVATPHH